LATVNIEVSLGVDYLIEVNVDRFPELLLPSYILTGQVKILSLNTLVCNFDIIKSPIQNRVYLILKSINTKNIVINNQHKYVYDIIAKNDNEVYKLIDGIVTFKPTITSI
jgi:hypothetical protein